MSRDCLVVTCEHASNAVPAWLGGRFASAPGRAALRSHRGWDIGVRPIYRALAAPARFSIAGDVSRLVVDLNRSLHHRKLSSEFMRGIGSHEWGRVVRECYLPYRGAVDRFVGDAISHGARVVHLSVHTFTPVLDGVERSIDVGVLYDPARGTERALAGRWLAALAHSGWRLRRNAPYRGTADGVVTALRRRFGGDAYLGLELEVSQAIASAEAATVLADGWKSASTWAASAYDAR